MLVAGAVFAIEQLAAITAITVANTTSADTAIYKASSRVPRATATRCWSHLLRVLRDAGVRPSGGI